MMNQPEETCPAPDPAVGLSGHEVGFGDDADECALTIRDGKSADCRPPAFCGRPPSKGASGPMVRTSVVMRSRMRMTPPFVTMTPTADISTLPIGDSVPILRMTIGRVRDPTVARHYPRRGMLNLPHIASGKVREIYEIDENHLLFVATDRISAYDVILNQEIPRQGSGADRAQPSFLRDAAHPQSSGGHRPESTSPGLTTGRHRVSDR